MTITYIILSVAIVLFLSGQLRPDLIALVVAVSLGLTGVLTSQEVFSGFSRSAVITILAIFILAEGLQQVGVTEAVGSSLLKIGGQSERKLMLVVTLSGAFLSLFMNNIAAASVLMPAVMGAARKSRVNPGRLLMPLAFGTILGGMATLFTTANIIVSSILRDQGLAGYGLLDFARLGIPLIAVGMLYLVFVGVRLLPSRTDQERWDTSRSEEGDLASIYRLGERLIRARIPAGSSLVERSLSQSNLRQGYRLNLVAIERNSQTIPSPTPEAILKPGDILLLEGRPGEISPEILGPALELLPDSPKGEKLESRTVSLIEAILAPRSALIGRTLRSTHFREKYRVNVIAIWRAGKPIRTNISDLTLEFGDALLLQGPREGMAMLRSESDLILLSGEAQRKTPQKKQAWLAVLIMGIALVLAATGVVPIAEAMLGGALAMILAGMLTIDRAYQVIDWKSIFLIAGMLPLGIAMTKTGAAANLGNAMISLLGPAGPLVLLLGLVVLTALLSQVINGAAVAAMMAPIAISAAGQMGVDPRAMAMGVALAASMTFLTPLGHPVNVLVMGPGGYSFRDYFKVGLPLMLLSLVVMMVLFPVFWPLS